MKNKEEEVKDNLQETVEETPEKEVTQEQETDSTADDSLAKLESELAEVKDKYLRLYSDFENFRKRNAKERLDLIKTASEDVLRDLIPVVDDFERALKDVNDKNKSNSGFNLIYNKLIDIFKQQGLEVMDVKPKDIFDAELHEAVTQIPSNDDFSKGEIVDIISPGYKLGELIIRYPKVVVAN